MKIFFFIFSWVSLGFCIYHGYYAIKDENIVSFAIQGSTAVIHAANLFHILGGNFDTI